jgi:hypothetical protein
MPHPTYLDPALFLQSIKYEDEDGNEETVSPWRFVEQIQQLSLEQEHEYVSAWACVDAHAVITQKFIPYIAHKSIDQPNTFKRLKDTQGEGRKCNASKPIQSTNQT